MPRRSRIVGVSNIYHCIFRGINKQDIFFDSQDYLKFKNIIKKSKEIFSYKLYSYVLMPNHIHLQVKIEKEGLSKIMHHIGLCYANYFNNKYARVGHVFQDRYNSLPVETTEYFLNLVRYIHQNPEKAGINVKEKYIWTSYKDYVKLDDSLIEIDDVLKLFSDNRIEAKKLFIQYNNQYQDIKESKELLEYEIKGRLTDQELIYFIQKKLKIDNIQEIQKYNNNEKRQIINELRKIKGNTIKQLSRVTGLNVKFIERALQMNNKNKLTCP